MNAPDTGEMAKIWADAHEVTKRERPVMRRRALSLMAWMRAVQRERPDAVTDKRGKPR